MLTANIHRVTLVSALIFGLIADPHAVLASELVRVAVIIIVADVFYSVREVVKMRRNAKMEQAAAERAASAA
jgi:hypothetical protein